MIELVARFISQFCRRSDMYNILVTVLVNTPHIPSHLFFFASSNTIKNYVCALSKNHEIDKLIYCQNCNKAPVGSIKVGIVLSFSYLW
jgi:hypothetical protein